MELLEAITGLVFLVVMGVFGISGLMGWTRKPKDPLNDRSELIKRVDDPYETDFWNKG